MTKRIKYSLEPATNDGFVTANKYIQATTFIVKTLTQRNEIPANLRALDGAVTTLCYVSATGFMYELINNPSSSTTANSDWKQIDFGVSRAGDALGTWESDNSNPVLQDATSNLWQNDYYVVTNTPTPTLVQHAGLFGGQQVSVKNGDLIISNGTQWFVSPAASDWDTMTKPQVIDDYVAGTVIAHAHIINDVTGLQDELNTKYDSDDVASLTDDYTVIPSGKLTTKGFMDLYFYRKQGAGIDKNLSTYNAQEIDDLVAAALPAGDTSPFVFAADEIGGVLKAGLDNPVRAIKSQQAKGAGTVQLTNGSASIVGIGTDFTDTNSENGVGFWYGILIVDSNNDIYKISIASIEGPLACTINRCYSKADIESGYRNTTVGQYTGVSGTYEFVVVDNMAEQNYTFAFGNNSLAKNYAFALGGHVVATGQTAFATGLFTFAGGAQSMVMGKYGQAEGDYSFAGGEGFSTLQNIRAPYAKGVGTFAFYRTDVNQVAGQGVQGAYAAILGGQNHNIPADSPRSVVLGGNAIKADAATADTVFMPKVRIGRGTGGALTQDDALTQMAAIDPSTGEIKWRDVASILTPPAGSAGDIQYSDGVDAFAASTKFNYDVANNNLIISDGITGASLIGQWNLIMMPDHTFATTTTGAESNWNAILGEATTFNFDNINRDINNGLVFGFGNEVKVTSPATGVYSFLIGGDGNLIEGTTGTPVGQVALGYGAIVQGGNAFGYGIRDVGVTENTLAQGYGSIAMFRVTASQTTGHGALATESVIIGGHDHNIPSDSTGSTILGGDTIKAAAATINTVYVPKIRINQGANAALVQNDAETQIAVIDSTTGELKYRDASTIGGSGSSGVNQTIQTSDGAGGFSSTAGNLINSSGLTFTNGLTSFSANNINVSNATSTLNLTFGVGGTDPYIGIFASKSDFSVFLSMFIDPGGELGAQGFVFAGRPAAYDIDYSAFYGPRSLVDKAYVDSVGGVTQAYVDTHLASKDVSALMQAAGAGQNNYVVAWVNGDTNYDLVDVTTLVPSYTFGNGLTETAGNVTLGDEAIVGNIGLEWAPGESGSFSMQPDPLETPNYWFRWRKDLIQMRGFTGSVANMMIEYHMNAVNDSVTMEIGPWTGANFDGFYFSYDFDAPSTYNIDYIFKDVAKSFGLKYFADYSTLGTANDRWIPDYGAVKAYADSVGVTIPYTADYDDATTNTVLLPMTFRRSTTGTPANGIGVGINFEVEYLSNLYYDIASIYTESTSIGTRVSDFVIDVWQDSDNRYEMLRYDKSEERLLVYGRFYGRMGAWASASANAYIDATAGSHMRINIGTAAGYGWYDFEDHGITINSQDATNIIGGGISGQAGLAVTTRDSLGTSNVAIKSSISRDTYTSGQAAVGFGLNSRLRISRNGGAGDGLNTTITWENLTGGSESILTEFEGWRNNATYKFMDFSGNGGALTVYAPTTFDVSIGGTDKINVTSAEVGVTVPLKLQSYTVAGVPTASSHTGAMIYVSNETGGATVAFSDGTNWRRVQDRAIIA